MNNRCITLLILIVLTCCVREQQTANPGSSKQDIITAEDSTRFVRTVDRYEHFNEVNRDSAYYYARQMLAFARQHHKRIEEAGALRYVAYQLMHLGKYAESLQNLLTAIQIAEDPESEKSAWILPAGTTPGQSRLRILAWAHIVEGHLMMRTNNTEQALLHYRFAKSLLDQRPENVFALGSIYMNLGRIYKEANQLDSALFYEKESESLHHKHPLIMKGFALTCVQLGEIYLRLGMKDMARKYFHLGIQYGKEFNNVSGLVRNYFGMTQYFMAEDETDSSLYYASQSVKSLLSLGPISGSEWNLGAAYENLFHIYQLRNQKDSAFKYLRIALVTQDSLYRDRIASLNEFQNLTFREKLHLQEKEKEKVISGNRTRTYAMLLVLGSVMLTAIVLYLNNRQKQQANKALANTLDELKTTQTQLIQSEKMASLGELTAGIAHEIQNPLNFVNNFSEVSHELVDEMNEEIGKGNTDYAKQISVSVKENLEKIIHHGKRADAIVKGMLQHSRSSSSAKEPTDLNALCDEYLRLSYHGLRAKDKSFNAKFETDFDPAIGSIYVKSQDIGRVILNLINNAFYAVSEKRKLNIPGYEPVVSISTEKEGGKISIRVKDNGTGIPPQAFDKIFQPFFTTKPAGEGTGLGLSLSYDIITKGHQGELKAETKGGEGTTFIIILPS